MINLNEVGRLARTTLAVLLLSACGGESTPRCAESPFACPEEEAQWRIRSTTPAQYQADIEVVSDRITGLMWQRTVPKNMYRWSQARDYCDGLGLASYDDWRLPSRLELITLVEYERNTSAQPRPGELPLPLINSSAFPETPPAEFWSASYFEGGTGTQAWTVSFGNGEITPDPLELMLPRVRCVRAATLTSEPGLAPPRPIQARFAVNTQTATETATGLVWSRSFTNSLSFWEASQYCATLQLDGITGFRLPHIKELMSIIAATATVKPFLDPDVFMISPYTYGLWTSTMVPTNGDVYSPEVGMIVEISEVGGGWRTPSSGSVFENFVCVRGGLIGSNVDPRTRQFP